MNGPFSEEQTQRARQIWVKPNSEWASPCETNYINPDFLKKIKNLVEEEIKDSSKADVISEIENLQKLYKEVNRREKIYLLAKSAIDKNRILADKTVLDYDPGGYCPPEKRKMLIETLRQIIELTKL